MKQHAGTSGIGLEFSGALIACLNLLGTDYLYFIFTGSLIAAWTVLASESTWRVRIGGSP